MFSEGQMDKGMDACMQGGIKDAYVPRRSNFVIKSYEIQ